MIRNIGNRDYTASDRRPTGMYAEPGKIVTISFPEKIIGKARVLIGFDGTLGEYSLKDENVVFPKMYINILFITFMCHLVVLMYLILQNA